ncbi:hypothetical protein CHU98_g2001 [Xylaria longipes]|nr:hypothetical protein CHU98_g2001 [Xylaria longipes]
MRMYTRAVIIKKIGWDDWTMVLAVILALITGVIVTLMVHYGVGRHTVYLIVNLVLIVVTFAQCTPVTFLWNRVGSNSRGTCWPPTIQQNYGYFQGAFSAWSDLILALFPILIIRQLNMPLRTKLANDFVPLRPHTTIVITLGPGQRSDVLVSCTGAPTDAVWMCSELDVACLNLTAHQPNATAAIYYDNANIRVLPRSKGTKWESFGCANDPLSKTIPLYPKAPEEPDVTKNIDITVSTNSTGNLLFDINGSTFYANYIEPLLRQIYYGHTNFPDHPEYNTIDMSNATSIRLIVRNYFYLPHNMHLRGTSDFWVLAEGLGDWDGEITNPKNPQRRDGQQLGPGSPELPNYVVI